MKLKLIVSVLLCVIAIFSLTSCSKKSTEEIQTESHKETPNRELQKVTLALNWLPESEHGGFYAALLDGFYERAGLDVEILPGGPDSPVIQRVGAKRVTFGVSNADRVILGRAQDAKIIALMAPLQHSPRCILVHEESGIKSLEELQNITLAMSDAPAFSHFLRHQLELKNVQIVRYTGSIAHFLRDKKFAQQGYVFSEPIVAKREGANVTALMVSELGFDPYSSVLITHDDTLKQQRKFVEKFTLASYIGWRRYLTGNPAKVHAHIHKINPEMSIEVLDAGLASLKKLCLNKQSNFKGTMTIARWKKLVEQLIEIKLLEPDTIKIDQLFVEEFLRANG